MSFFFLVSSNGLLKGGGLFVRGEDRAREKFVEEKIRLYRGEERQVCHDCNWTTHREKGGGTRGEG